MVYKCPQTARLRGQPIHHGVPRQSHRTEAPCRAPVSRDPPGGRAGGAGGCACRSARRRRRGGRPPAPCFGAIVERIAWWAELFEVPCVGFAANADEVAPLAAAGADFVAVGDWVFADTAGPADAIAAAARRLALAEPVG